MYQWDVSRYGQSTVWDLSSWDVSEVAFNGDLSKWDVSDVAFDGDLSKWDVSDVAFNGDLSQWEGRSVSDMVSRPSCNLS
jgi:hypothetical protein